MKLCIILMCLCALGAAAPSVESDKLSLAEFLQDTTVEERNLLVNALVRQLLAYLRRIINNGSTLLGIPPLDPLNLDDFHLSLPTGLINLELDLKDIVMTGLGGFVVHKSDLNLRQLTFDIDISVPKINIGAGYYDLVGDLYGAIPLFGKGKAKFQVDDFRFQAKLFLKQSEDGRSILIDRIESPAFVIPKLQSKLTGVIGGGDIDGIVNAITEQVIIGYVNRFQAAIAKVTSRAIVTFGNPILDRLDTWHYIAPLLPRSTE